MKRGGARALAARFMFGCLLAAAPAAGAQARSRDLGFATVRYENGLTLSALTLYEAVTGGLRNAPVTADGLVSLFSDGRWSMQGSVEATRRSEAVPLAPRFGGLFSGMRSEASLGAASTAQTGFMPTLAVLGRGRLVFEHEARGGTLGAAVARTFDGRNWQTTLLGEVHAWVQRGDASVGITLQPMQLAVGDQLGDAETEAQWTRGNTTLATTLGIRIGEARRGTVGWASFSLTRPVRQDIWATFSAGSYPADLLQSLPGGRFLSFAIRLPNGRLPPLHLPPPPPPPVRRPPELPTTARLSLVVGFALDSADLREIRVWAPGARKVELLADFVDWIPVPLIRQPDGVWRGYYRVAPGLHSLNVLIDGRVVDTPDNLAGRDDGFGGRVALVVVR
jgi:hypothetical protein